MDWLQVAAIETAVSKQTSSLPQRANFNIITLTSGERRSILVSGLWALLFTSSWASTGFFSVFKPVPREVSATTHVHPLSTRSLHVTPLRILLGPTVEELYVCVNTRSSEYISCARNICGTSLLFYMKVDLEFLGLFFA